jgi:hypothetical protein
LYFISGAFKQRDPENMSENIGAKTENMAQPPNDDLAIKEATISTYGVSSSLESGSVKNDSSALENNDEFTQEIKDLWESYIPRPTLRENIARVRFVWWWFWGRSFFAYHWQSVPPF